MGGVASRPSSAMPLEERSVRLAEPPPLYKHDGVKRASADAKKVQTTGLNEGFVRMFKWARNRILDSDGGGQLE